jgi:hypothetical protein
MDAGCHNPYARAEGYCGNFRFDERDRKNGLDDCEHDNRDPNLSCASHHETMRAQHKGYSDDVCNELQQNDVMAKTSKLRRKGRNKIKCCGHALHSRQPAFTRHWPPGMKADFFKLNIAMTS